MKRFTVVSLCDKCCVLMLAILKFVIVKITRLVNIKYKITQNGKHLFKEIKKLYTEHILNSNPLSNKMIF